ncbi:hypothetical protein [Streptomyces sp. G45]|uniref:hypothetical protein n=1 Tax=Streptomyces sp. G45 TaxID=3406627 RepID=UPI003C1F8154
MSGSVDLPRTPRGAGGWDARSQELVTGDGGPAPAPTAGRGPAPAPPPWTP